MKIDAWAMGTSLLVAFVVCIFLNYGMLYSIYGFIFEVELASFARILVATLFIFAPSQWFRRYRREHIAGPIFAFLYILHYCPLIAAIFLFNPDFGNSVLVCTILFISFFILHYTSQLRLGEVKLMPFRRPDFFWLTLVATVLCGGVILAHFGAPRLNFSYSTLYEARTDFFLSVQSDLLTRISVYLTYWLAIVFFPILISQYQDHFLAKLLKIFYIMFCVYVFLFLTTKIILLISITFLFFLRRHEAVQNYNKIFFSYAVIIAIVLCSLSIVGYNIITRGLFEAIVRVLYLPGLLGSAYFEHFAATPWTTEGGYTHPAYEIGAVYFNSDSMLAVNSYWATAFAFNGFIGVIGVSAILGLYLSLLNSVAQGATRHTIAALSPILAYILANTGLHTAMFTYGLLPLLLVAACSPRRRFVN